MLSQPPWKDQTDRCTSIAEANDVYRVFFVHGICIPQYYMMFKNGYYWLLYIDDDEEKKESHQTLMRTKKKNMLKWLLQHVGHVNIHLGLQKLKYVEPFDPNKNRNVSQCVYGKFRSNRILTSGAALLFFLCCWSFDHFSSQMSSINTKFKVIRDIQQTKKFFFIIAFDDEVFQAFNLCALTRKR